MINYLLLANCDGYTLSPDELDGKASKLGCSYLDLEEANKNAKKLKKLLKEDMEVVSIQVVENNYDENLRCSIQKVLLESRYIKKFKNIVD